MNTRLNAKGQIIIPPKIRKKLDIKPRTRFLIEVDEKRKHIILKPIIREYIHSQRGKLKGKGLMKSLMEEKNFERRI